MDMTQVIVVDDDLTNVTLTKMLLELEGFEVIGCTNLIQAQAASSAQTKGYVVDINLARGENGLDLLRMIRAGATAGAANSVVIITSGDYRREQEAIAAGADKFLFKPYAPGDLPKLLKTLIEGGAYE